jgi:hypothetical protein
MKLSAIATCSLISVLAIAAGCSTADTTADESSSSDKVCVSVRTIDSFASISDREIFVTARTNDSYVFTVMGVCQGLRSANAIGVADSMGRICGDGFGRVVFQDMGRKQSCRVKSIDAVANLDEAKALAASRKAGSDEN